jgi:hypothetical protein
MPYLFFPEPTILHAKENKGKLGIIVEGEM